MISWLKGAVKYKSDESITLDVSGVGYHVFMLPSELKELQTYDIVELNIHMYQRETGSELYGFKEMETKQFFEQLLSISGVGPKGGLGVLSQANTEDIKKAIVHGDPTVLTKVSGIGKKTAERIIVELKNKIDGAESIDQSGDDVTNIASALEALEQLGYSKTEARQTLQTLPKEIKRTEDKVREALKSLGAPKT